MLQEKERNLFDLWKIFRIEGWLALITFMGALYSLKLVRVDTTDRHDFHLLLAKMNMSQMNLHILVFKFFTFSVGHSSLAKFDSSFAFCLDLKSAFLI